MLLAQGTIADAVQDLQFTGTWEGPDAVRRWLGCVLMLSIPEEATVEALDSLRDIWEFYSWSPSKKIVPPESSVVGGEVLPPSARPLLEIGD